MVKPSAGSSPSRESPAHSCRTSGCRRSCRAFPQSHPAPTPNVMIRTIHATVRPVGGRSLSASRPQPRKATRSAKRAAYHAPGPLARAGPAALTGRAGAPRRSAPAVRGPVRLWVGLSPPSRASPREHGALAPSGLLVSGESAAWVKGSLTRQVLSVPHESRWRNDDGAGDETRTRDIQLGRNVHGFEFRSARWRRCSALLRVLMTGHGWTRLRQPRAANASITCQAR
jgi:hypothetical protein